MTTLNTIIEEEKKAITHKYDLRYFDGSTYAVTEEFEKDFTTAMQRAYEAGREERDTYWKERVEEAVKAERERILKACDVNSFLRDEDHEDFVVYLTDIETITKATPITNEDNLK